jgi:hypothetical protein
MIPVSASAFHLADIMSSEFPLSSQSKLAIN